MMETGAVNSLIQRFGGEFQRGAIRIPAENLEAYVRASAQSGVPVPYIECLFQGAKGTRPSSDYSRTSEDFASFDEMLAFSVQAAKNALEEAAAHGERAMFEVGTVSRERDTHTF